MNRKIALVVLTLVLSLAAAAQDAKKNAQGKKAEAKAAEASNTQVAQPTAAPDEYVIGPDDVLHISIWKEPELSGQVVVRPDGKISLALLNDLQAAGTTPLKLGNDITEKLKQYVTDPRVTVTVLQMNSRRVFVMGQVQRAGAFPMLPNMTLMQLMSSAGGLSPYANMKKIYLLRNENGKPVKIPVNYKALVKGDAPEQNIPLKPGDTLVIP